MLVWLYADIKSTQVFSVLRIQVQLNAGANPDALWSKSEVHQKQTVVQNSAVKTTRNASELRSN